MCVCVCGRQNLHSQTDRSRMPSPTASHRPHSTFRSVQRMASDDDVRKELDGRIGCLEMELCDLKQRRNTFLPISRLPPEIACKIFVYSLPELDYQKHNGGLRRLHTMELSHVSHCWRATALECSELWAGLQVGVHTREEMLVFAREKACQVPISVNLCGFTYSTGSYDSDVPSDLVISTLTKCKHN